MQQIARVLILMLPIAEGQQDEKDPAGNDMAHRVEEETGHDGNVDDGDDTHGTDETRTDQVQGGLVQMGRCSRR